MASVSPVGSAIFVNQMTPAAASIQNGHNNRVDFQNMIAQTLTNEKDEKVLEVRPTEDNQEVDPDREHQKDEAERETKRAKKREREEEEDAPAEELVHHLDIRV